MGKVVTSNLAKVSNGFGRLQHRLVTTRYINPNQRL